MSFPLAQAALHSHWLTFKRTFYIEMSLHVMSCFDELEELAFDAPLEFHKTGFRTPRWR